MKVKQIARGQEMAAVSCDDYLQVSPYEADGGEKIGLEPSAVAKDKLRALGHPASPTDAIRVKCIDCSGGSLSEVRKCLAINCPLWPYRMGRNPFHARATSRNADTLAAEGCP
jgi:hypothetical protein